MNSTENNLNFYIGEDNQEFLVNLQEISCITEFMPNTFDVHMKNGISFSVDKETYEKIKRSIADNIQI